MCYNKLSFIDIQCNIHICVCCFTSLGLVSLEKFFRGRPLRVIALPPQKKPVPNTYQTGGFHSLTPRDDDVTHSIVTSDPLLPGHGNEITILHENSV